MKVVLRFSKAEAYAGSYAAVTSAEIHFELYLTSMGFALKDAAMVSITSEITLDCIPVVPSLPTSSLSANTATTVWGEL